MVFYSEQADIDLDNILQGLLNWDRFTLTKEHCEKYVSDIISICDALDNSIFHTHSTFPEHKRFGKYVYHYRRSKNTTWYIIYNNDRFQNIYIQHIVSNHLTIIETE